LLLYQNIPVFLLNVERKTIFLVMIVSSIFGVGLMLSQSSAESPNAIRFHDSSYLGPQISLDGIQILNLGQQAVITVNIEKLIDSPVDDVIVKASLTNSENGEFLLIPRAIVIPGFKMADPAVLERSEVIAQTLAAARLVDNSGIKEQLYEKQDITHPIMFQVIAIDSSAEPFKDTVEVVLYLDEKVMDRLSFDVVVKTKGI